MPTAESLSRSQKVIYFVIITAVLFCAFVFYSLPGAFLPLYDEDRQITSVWTGVLIGAGPLSYISICLVSAVLLNSFSNKVLLRMPTFILGTTTILFAFTDLIKDNVAYSLVGIVIRSVQGVCGGIISATSFASLVSLYPTKVATVTALAETVLNGALAFGPFFGGVLYNLSGFRLAFAIPGALILLTVIPQFYLPQLTSGSPNITLREFWGVIINPWILFAGWHCSACQVLLNYHIPILSPYVERAFNADVVWSGTALLINCSTICIVAPILGILVDRYNPYIFVVISSIFLPVLYLLMGPVPIFHITSSKTQLLASLALLGLFVPMGATPILLILFDLYKMKNNDLPNYARNALVSFYCASFPFGAFLGVTVAGIVAEYAWFEWSTGMVGFLFFIQSVASWIFCWLVHCKKKQLKDQEKTPLSTDEQ